ncbi:MAG: type II toxin-antitoxin system RelE/ParE family toxin [Clostridiales bacterium]|nr:type II toxin-antitoxin system RelE/ParE family toxin [Clostridiales bacterium]MDD7036010.1 type II toxin-antitoxin system RelE/ParE family toxin [Bacillota bacterium]MDY2921097.1 type II toxin-antitoxin system RelE/ParE family toxin [Lentihominibacter sp.]
MTYDVKYEKKAVKQIQKLDPSVQRLIKTWIEKNLIGTTNPRQHGKGLVGDKSDYWRYGVGDYRILAKINDTEVIIIIVEVGHRKEIYKG